MSATWRTEKLQNLVTFKTGKLDSNAAIPGGAYPFFTCSQETLRTNTYSFDQECVLLAGNNANGIYPLKYFNGKFDAYQRTYVITVKNPEVLLTRYLYYTLRPKLSEFRSTSTGAATKFLTMGILNGTQITFPTSPAIQSKIVRILSSYDDLLENNLKRIQTLEKMGRYYYREYVKLKSEGKETALDDICSLSKNKYDDRHHAQLPLLDLSRIPQNTLAPNAFGCADELTTSRIVFEAGDTLFGAIRPYLHKVVNTPFSGITNVSVLVLHPKASKYRSFLAFAASEPGTIRWADTHSTGTKMPVIHWDVFSNMQIPKLDEPKALEFEKSVGPILDQIGILSLKNINLIRSRDLLLPRLISGELDVASEEYNLSS